MQYRESQEFRNQQIQVLRQQQEVRRSAFQDSYYNADGRQSLRPSPLSCETNYHMNSQKISCQGRKNSIISMEMSTPVFYPQVNMDAHQVVPITSRNQEPKGKGSEVSHIQNNAIPNMV